MVKSFRNTGFLALILALASACGGGDGVVPGFIDENPVVTSNLATIDADTSPAVAGVAARQILEDSLINTLTTTGIPVIGSGSGAAQDMLRLSGSPLLPNLAAAQMTLAPCQIGGTMDVTFTAADPGTITQGDAFSIIFDACDNGGGVEISGGLAMTVSGISGDPASEQFELGLMLELDAFSVSQDGQVSAASGSISISIDARQSPITTITVDASELTATNGGISETLTNLSITFVEDQGMFPPAVSIDTGFTLSSPRLDGDIVVSTEMTLQRSGGEFPYDGAISIRGDANASVTLIALGPGAVRLEIDVDGDGATDLTIDTTWAEILAEAG